LIGLEIGSQISLSVEHGSLVARPAGRERKHYTLAELLKGSGSMKKLTAETAWAQEGDPVGHEIA